MYLDSPIGEIYDCTGYMQISCDPPDACPVPNPLNSPADENLYGFHRYIPCISFIASPSSSNTSSRSDD